MALLKTMEEARQRMLQARRRLDDYDEGEGTPAWNLAEHSRLSETLVAATDQYIQLVAQFLRQNPSNRKRPASGGEAAA